MTRIFIVFLSLLTAVFYFMLYGHANHNLELPLMYSKIEAHIPVWSIQLAMAATYVGWVFLTCQKFHDVVGTIWAIGVVLIGGFATFVTWYMIWGSIFNIEDLRIRWPLIVSFSISSIVVSTSMGARRATE